jgi:hypothetical protein
VPHTWYAAVLPLLALGVKGNSFNILSLIAVLWYRCFVYISYQDMSVPFFLSKDFIIKIIVLLNDTFVFLRR